MGTCSSILAGVIRENRRAAVFSSLSATLPCPGEVIIEAVKVSKILPGYLKIYQGEDTHIFVDL